ncbi:hypothetical protein ACFPK9_02840 [Rubritalea spongiae]|uniref:Replication protein n=1 Tax=Rubritalea spongiae TaxID=430797 RepID=A0ABW5E3E0_9BACT
MEADKIKRLPDAPTPESQQSETDLRGFQTNTHNHRKQVYTLKPREAGGCGCAAKRAAPTVSQAEREYLEICRRESGEEVDLEQYEKTQAQRTLLEAQSKSIGEKLESVGVKSFEDTKLHIIGLITGIAEPITSYRNIVFLPSVAARKRRKMLLQLEYFMWKNKHCRMWVFTTGQRTSIENVREEIGVLHRRLSRLNNQSFMKAAGVQIVFRSTELGSLERIAGEATFHLHAHTIIKLSRYLPPEDWSYLLKRVRGWWKHHFSDSKEIHSAREACKYVVKPSDVESLEAFELKELYEQMFRLHLVQCLGELKAQRKEFKDADVMPRKQGEIWTTVGNWNAGRGKPSTKPSNGNSLVCTLPPAAYVDRLKEPAAIVMNYMGRKLHNDRLKRAHEAALDKLHQ